MKPWLLIKFNNIINNNFIQSSKLQKENSCFGNNTYFMK